jgi:hypothetical protein
MIAVSPPEVTHNQISPREPENPQNIQAGSPVIRGIPAKQEMHNGICL